MQIAAVLVAVEPELAEPELELAAEPEQVQQELVAVLATAVLRPVLAIAVQQGQRELVAVQTAEPGQIAVLASEEVRTVAEPVVRIAAPVASAGQSLEEQEAGQSLAERKEPGNRRQQEHQLAH